MTEPAETEDRRREFMALLAEINMTQTELGRRLGKSEKQVSFWASGRSPVPVYALAFLRLLKEKRWPAPYGGLSANVAWPPSGSSV